MAKNQEVEENKTENENTVPVNEDISTVTLTQEELKALLAQTAQEAVLRMRSEQSGVNVESKPQDEELEKQRLYMAEKVPIMLFKDKDKYTEPLVVAVNGVTYQIQRGIKVEVPRYVAEVIENSIGQDTTTSNYTESLSRKFEEV